MLGNQRIWLEAVESIENAADSLKGVFLDASIDWFTYIRRWTAIYGRWGENMVTADSCGCIRCKSHLIRYILRVNANLPHCISVHAPATKSDLHCIQVPVIARGYEYASDDDKASVRRQSLLEFRENWEKKDH